jgi:capsular exopolysaccharide synthesis family protein
MARGKMQKALRKGDVRPRGDDAPRGEVSAASTAAAATFALSAGARRGEVDPHVVVLTDPECLQARQFRAIRDGLAGLYWPAPPQVFVVAAATSGDGTSVTAANLAFALAEEQGRRVVLVDANLRSPAVHRLLGVDNQRGLADYLAGGTMVEMAVQRSPLPNLWAMCSGRTAPNPAELLGSKRLEDLVSRLRRDYDYVVVDAAPVDAGPDAAAVCPRGDGTLLVVRLERTTSDAARTAVGVLRKAGAKVVGTIVTGVEREAE